jgi:hypothetical protein
MKTELSKVAQDLEQGKITEIEAQTLLLGLFSVSKSLRPYSTDLINDTRL